MKLIQWADLDAYFNLAVEEYVFEQLASSEDYFLLWQNRNAVVVGKHQNTVEEINIDYVREHAVQVVRRLSGGGAVYHDLGNLNYSLVTKFEEGMVNAREFSKAIVTALSSLGVEVEFSARNDLLIHGKKISGAAQHIRGGRILHHGTLLFQSDLDALSHSLKARGDKIESRGIKSIRSQVTNICEAYPGLSIPLFQTELVKTLHEGPDVQDYDLTAADRALIADLRDQKYSTWEWNYGRSPQYTIEKKRQVREGWINIFLHVNAGVIDSIQISGEYLGDEAIIAIEQSLNNVKLTENDVEKALLNIDNDTCLASIHASELAHIIVN